LTPHLALMVNIWCFFPALASKSDRVIKIEPEILHVFWMIEAQAPIIVRVIMLIDTDVSQHTRKNYLLSVDSIAIDCYVTSSSPSLA
jgi:hypothetical protein